MPAFKALVVFEDVGKAEATLAFAKMLLALEGAPVINSSLELVPTIHPTPTADGDVLRVYTDGGCKITPSGSAGAWAYVIVDGNHVVAKNSAPASDTTNNRMEMMAVIQALTNVPIGPKIHLILDSKYVMSGATQWIKGWRRNGWKTYTGEQVKNKDLWIQLEEVMQLHVITWTHVKGHTGNVYNEMCDAMCSEWIAKHNLFQEAGPDEGGGENM